MVPSELILKLKEEYNEFIIPFKSEPYLSNGMVQNTIGHIEKVVSNILILADSLDLSENEKCIAEIVARFHTIGRLWLLLPENSEKSMDDRNLAGQAYLKNSSNFQLLDESFQTLILQVFEGHIHPEAAKKENEVVVFYTKLLGDADKLDSWRAMSDYLSHRGNAPILVDEMNLSKKPTVTPLFYKSIIDKEIPNKKEIVTVNDFILYQMSWIFDLHFKKSYQIVNKQQYMRHLYDSLPKNDSVIEIYRMIRIHIENHI